MVEELGVALSPEDRELAFRTLDKDHSGNVDFVEFAEWFRHVTKAEQGKVLSPGLGLLKLALSATRVRAMLTYFDICVYGVKVSITVVFSMSFCVYAAIFLKLYYRH